MSDQREENVYLAKLAEQAERYDGMEPLKLNILLFICFLILTFFFFATIVHSDIRSSSSE